MQDPDLFGKVFAAPSWSPWRAFAASLFGLPLEGDALALYQQCTGREKAPAGPAKEAFVVAGRRSGKSMMAGFLAAYLAACRQYRLSPGERPVVLICAVDKTQAKVVFGYTVGLLESCPLRSPEIVGRTAETVTLSNGVTVEVRSSNFRSVRGVTLAGVVLDELACWRACTRRDVDQRAPHYERVPALQHRRAADAACGARTSRGVRTGSAAKCPEGDADEARGGRMSRIGHIMRAHPDLPSDATPRLLKCPRRDSNARPPD